MCTGVFRPSPDYVLGLDRGQPLSPVVVPPRSGIGCGFVGPRANPDTLAISVSSYGMGMADGSSCCRKLCFTRGPGC